MNRSVDPRPAQGFIWHASQKLEQGLTHNTAPAYQA